MQTIVSVFKTLGFPVAVCAVLLYFCFCTIESNTAALRTLDKSVNILTVIVLKESGLKLSELSGEKIDATLKQLNEEYLWPK